MRTVATNRKARHLYNIVSTFEAGIVLVGTEVKSVKASKLSLSDSYARIEDGEAFLYNMHISIYEKADQFSHYQTRRKRKLLLRKTEIRKLTGKLQERGYTLVPLKVYISDRGIVKVEMGLAKGKRKFEKRQAIKEREVKRELEREQKAAKR
jgi:SsrA-binding protein